MAVEFLDIYSEAIGLFDDPNITKAFQTNKILFCKIMYSYLQNAIPLYNNPMKMQILLSSQNKPSGQVEIFDGDGTATYTISTTPLSNSIYQFVIDGNVIDGTYNSTNNSITFSTEIPIGKEGGFEWYYPGEFINDFNDTVLNILARLLVVCWTEKEKNFLLDIRRMLQDTDFKLGNEANSLRSKGLWFAQSRNNVITMMNKYAWTLKYNERFGVGGYYNG